MKNILLFVAFFLIGGATFGQQNVEIKIVEKSDVFIHYEDGTFVQFKAVENANIVLDKKLSAFIDIKNVQTNTVTMLHKEGDKITNLHL